MLNALSVSVDALSPGTRRAELSLRQQGLTPAFRMAWQGGVVHAWSRPEPAHQSTTAHGSPVPEGAVCSSDGSACCIGPLWYRGLFGSAALELLLQEFELPAGLDETLFRGNFALVLCKAGRAWLLNDPLGLVRIYSSKNADFYSTSWLATRAFAGDSDVNPRAAAEYVLLGAVHDDSTVSRGVSKLPLGCGIDLSERKTWKRFPQGMVPAAPPFASLDAAVEDVALSMQTAFREITAPFEQRISAALSGGFDSRLILAALLRMGIRPRLFVYGGPDSPDVSIAQAVARAENLPLRIVDKDLLNRDLPVPGIPALVRAALFFDGLPNDGILDPGADRLTRMEQTAGNFLSLNGGGGEIFRNFFNLADRPLSAHDVVLAFYRGFDRAVFRRQAELGRYQERLVSSIEGTLGVARPTAGASAGARYERDHLELVYPLFRCHHWMGLNNSVANRSGYFSTPLMDLQTVRAASRIPLRWKNAGLFESRLITALHHTVASHPSAYGFAFSEGPNRSKRLEEWLTRLRPPAVRPLVNAMNRSLKRVRVSAALLAHCRSLYTGEWRIESSLDIARLPDDAALARALAIEVVTRELAP